MGKRGDLWDDSALVNAFDTAMSKFKDMHNINGRNETNSTACGDANENPQAVGEFSPSGGSGETKRCIEGQETDKSGSHPPPTATKSEDPETLTGAGAGEQRTVHVQAHDEHIFGSSSIQTQNIQYLAESQDNHTYLPESQDNGTYYLPLSQGIDDYYQLCKENLELEEKRLQLWYRFQQYSGDWNYQYQGGSCQNYASYGGADDGGSASQELLYPNQGSHPTAPNSSLPSCSPCAPCCVVPSTGPEVGSNAGERAATTKSDIDAEGMAPSSSLVSSKSDVVSCCPWTCPGSVAPSSSFPSCSLCGPCCVASTTGNETANNGRDPPAITESDIVRIGMEAAEKVMSTLKVKHSDSGVETGKCISTTNSVDLDDVLKAWYTAGLYTGKYLAEKSLISKRDG